MEQRRADGASHPPAKSAQGPARGAYLTMNPRPVNSPSGNRAGGVFFWGGGGRRPDAGCQIPDAGCRIGRIGRVSEAGAVGKAAASCRTPNAGAWWGRQVRRGAYGVRRLAGAVGGSDGGGRSSDFQSAGVSRVFNPPQRGEPLAGADWKSAIQQVGNLRYGPTAGRRRRHAGARALPESDRRPLGF
jgi:hypothetical protein